MQTISGGMTLLRNGCVSGLFDVLLVKLKIPL
jgi:hypothetical protein